MDKPYVEYNGEKKSKQEWLDDIAEIRESLDLDIENTLSELHDIEAEILDLKDRLERTKKERDEVYKVLKEQTEEKTTWSKIYKMFYNNFK